MSNKGIDRLAADLRKTFPEMGGLSTRNLLAMKVFAREFPDGPIAQQPVAQLPWGHILRGSLPTIEEIEAELAADLPNEPEAAP